MVKTSPSEANLRLRRNSKGWVGTIYKPTSLTRGTRGLEYWSYLKSVRSLDRSPHRLFSDPLYAVVEESTAAYTSDETARA